MESLAALLTKVFEWTPRNAWVIIFGLLVYGLLQTQLPAQPWPVLALAAFAVSVLLVSFLAFLFGKWIASREESKSKQQSAARTKRIDETILSTIATLGQEDRAVLSYILQSFPHNGGAFKGGYNAEMNVLIAASVVSVVNQTADLYRVHPVVWKDRERIIKEAPEFDGVPRNFEGADIYNPFQVI